MVGTRLLEVLGIMMIGEGVLAVANPRGHIGLWRSGPRWWEAMAEPFAERPGLVRCLGATEAALGFWLATRQMNRAE